MKVLIRGAGDIASGIALRLHRAGMQVVMTDLPAPLPSAARSAFPRLSCWGR